MPTGHYYFLPNLTALMKKIIFSVITFLLVITAAAQPIDSTIEKIANQYAPEKTWLHYDKSAYYPGETIWFKAYLMEGMVPADGSKTLYVDWVGDNGAVLSHTVSPVVDAITNGQFAVPEDYTGNFVHVRAYTKWMLNFDTAFLYNKDIRILSASKPAKGEKPTAVFNLEFFPEGGDAVMGIANRIAFKAADQWGKPFNIKGIITDNTGKAIDSFHSVHDGMGSFIFLPQTGQTYAAQWTDARGVKHTTPLAIRLNSGISMQVSGKGTQKIIALYSSASLPDNLKTIHLVGTLNQHMAFKTDVVLEPGANARRVIPTDKFPSGILTITLFDAGWNAVAERICFINNNDYSFQPTVEVEHWGLSKRKRNDIRISVPPNMEGASFSVSVTDAAIEKDTASTIISHFLLTSELKGRINNPAYYFSAKNDTVAQHLDLVMMTSGWRRFRWEDVARGRFPSITYGKDTSYLTFSGKVFGVTRSQLSGKDNIVVIVKGKDSSTKMLVMPIATDGSFYDHSFFLMDTVQAYYSLKSKLFREAEAKFMPDRLPAPNYGAFSKNFVNYNPYADTTGSYRHTFLAAERSRLDALERGKIMEAVTVKTKTKSPVQILDEKYTGGLFKGGDASSFDLVNDPASGSYQNVLQYLQGKIAGLTVGMNNGASTVSWRGGTPEIFLDELRTDIDMIDNVPVADIAYVKVFRPPFVGGFGGGGSGAIAIYTRKGSDATGTRGGLSSNKVTGYTPIRQFYSPNYDSFDPRNEQADIRTTLYWNPLLSTTAKKQNVAFSFYNNDVSKSFRIVIEGMTKDGLLAHYEQILE